MEQVPEFWRTEIFHPLSVHFPIALLLMALLFKAVFFNRRNIAWAKSGTLLLILGVLGAWIAVFTGSLADGIVSRKICDPTVLKDHENMAYFTAWCFSVALATDLLSYPRSLITFRRPLKIFTLAVLITGSVALILVGHSGASVVYQQGGGVYMPSEDCSEFE